VEPVAAELPPIYELAVLFSQLVELRSFSRRQPPAGDDRAWAGRAQGWALWRPQASHCDRHARFVGWRCGSLAWRAKGGGDAGLKLRDAQKAKGDCRIEIIKRSDAAQGFKVLPRQWVVRRALARSRTKLPPSEDLASLQRKR
jgi:hypothetical protein